VQWASFGQIAFQSTFTAGKSKTKPFSNRMAKPEGVEPKVPVPMVGCRAVQSGEIRISSDVSLDVAGAITAPTPSLMDR